MTALVYMKGDKSLDDDGEGIRLVNITTQILATIIHHRLSSAPYGTYL